MKALVYHGPKNVSVKEVPDAEVEHPMDVPVKITTTKILRAARTSNPAKYSATKTSGRSSKWEKRWRVSKSATWFACHSISAVDFVKIVNEDSPAFVSR